MRPIRTNNIFRLLAGLTLAALSSNLSGQLFNEERLLCLGYSGDENYTAIYPGDNSFHETTMAHLLETGMKEETLQLEPWMTIPFERAVAEENLRVESWMNVPFKAGEETEIEDWMTDTWI